MEERKTANMAHLAIGQRVKALRMSNKAVAITGTIDALNDDGKTVVVKHDGGDGLETVHADDVTVLDGTAASSGKEEKPAASESLTTVNGKPI